MTIFPRWHWIRIRARFSMLKEYYRNKNMTWTKFKAKNRAKWKKWDWIIYDAELARIHKISRERIRQIRNILGFQSLKQKRSIKSFLEENADKINNSNLTVKELADDLGVSIH